MEQNVYNQFSVKKVINASGKMTILGGSRLSSSVSDACRTGASNFFEIADLLHQTGAYIADLLHVEDSYIVSSASSGIAQCVAASIARQDLGRILHIPMHLEQRCEIILPKGHNVDYGTPIELTISMGGGAVVEAGYANACKLSHVESCINEHTAALLYVKSHHCVQKGICSITEMAKLAERYHLPLIVDAAAEEDLTAYLKMGADAVIYSGTKALEGPTSGLIVGKAAFLQDVKAQKAGIGRVMKVGKENILGLVQAIESYVKTPRIPVEAQKERLHAFHSLVEQLPGIRCTCVMDGAGRPIVRSELTFTKDCPMTAAMAAQKLKEGELRIYTRDYRANLGVIEIDIRDVNETELRQIYDKLHDLLKGEQ